MTLDRIQLINKQITIAKETRQDILNSLDAGDITITDILTNKYLNNALFEGYNDN